MSVDCQLTVTNRIKCMKNKKIFFETNNVAQNVNLIGSSKDKLVEQWIIKTATDYGSRVGCWLSSLYNNDQAEFESQIKDTVYFDLMRQHNVTYTDFFRVYKSISIWPYSDFDAQVS